MLCKQQCVSWHGDVGYWVPGVGAGPAVMIWWGAGAGPAVMIWWGAEGLAQRETLPCGLSLAPSSAADVASGSLSPGLHLRLAVPGVKKKQEL